LPVFPFDITLFGMRALARRYLSNIFTIPVVVTNQASNHWASRTRVRLLIVSRPAAPGAVLRSQPVSATNLRWLCRRARTAVLQVGGLRVVPVPAVLPVDRAVRQSGPR
jgi:hypothetical protein